MFFKGSNHHGFAKHHELVAMYINYVYIYVDIYI